MSRNGDRVSEGPTGDRVGIRDAQQQEVAPDDAPASGARPGEGTGVDPVEPGRVFLVHLSDGSTDHYETVLQELGHHVVSWGSVQKALQHLSEHSPDLLVLDESHRQEVKDTLAAQVGTAALLPDVVLLEPMDRDLASPSLRTNTAFWSMPLDFLHADSSSSLGSLSFRSLIHPADPYEFAQAVSHVLAGRVLRRRHFMRQGVRRLYSRCGALPWVVSAGSLYRLGLSAAMDVSGVSAGGVADFDARQEIEVKFSVGPEPQVFQRILGLGLKWEQPRGLRWRWFKVPELLVRAGQRALAGNILVIPLAERDSGVLMLTLLTGQRTVLPQDMTSDLELVVDHIRIGLERVGEAAVPAENRWRDPWTGLFNREGILRAAGRALDGGELPVGLLVADIDRFKEHNDRMGHLVGGALLRACARRLLAQVPSARWVGRIGPDEFAVVLPGRSKEDTLKTGESIVNAVQGKPVDTKEADVPVELTVTVGVAAAGSTRWSAQRLLERAFDALNAGKKEGGNRAFAL